MSELWQNSKDNMQCFYQNSYFIDDWWSCAASGNSRTVKEFEIRGFGLNQSIRKDVIILRNHIIVFWWRSKADFVSFIQSPNFHSEFFVAFFCQIRRVETCQIFKKKILYFGVSWHGLFNTLFLTNPVNNENSEWIQVPVVGKRS